MTNKPLWQPSASQISTSQMQAFYQQLHDNLGVKFQDYQQMHQWSIEQPEKFWQEVWQFAGIKASQPYQQVLSDQETFINAKWFVGAKLNFAENLLRNRSSKKLALVSYVEDGTRRSLSYQELYQQVSQFAASLRKVGVTSGDRVAGFMPNIIETVIAMLATSSIGAIWSSCSPDFGSRSVIDRLGQVKPKVLFACDGYFYNGKTIDCTPRINDICQAIDSIEKTVVVPVLGSRQTFETSEITHLEAFLALADPTLLRFEQLPFEHPLYVMYSSGTTGVPKCIVHSAGGTLIQHLKEHQLHLDLQANDVLFYFTTCGWMMWNWLISGLASEATIVLYDGNPAYPHNEVLLDIVDAENISHFGVSAKYISNLEKTGATPIKSHKLSSLKSILSTGSPLSEESFHYVYRAIKQDVCLSSISGGTDIISCFVLGNTCLPVWEGEIQCRGLGMAIEFWDDSGKPVTGKKGEMVCTHPFPSAPIGLWNDPDNERYKKTYFSSYPNIWNHGDYGELTEHGGVIIHGRSDAILNPGGVRIGTAEVYRQVDKVPEVMESVCIGQQKDGDVRVVLFVVLRDGYELDEGLQQKIRQTIRLNTSPRHVPEKIIAVTDIPKTINGKIVELAVRNVVHNEPVKNIDSLANPEALNLFKNHPEIES